MNILVIKQTSLGDVLHASGHIRAIKQCYPDSRLTLMTATTSADIYRHNPWVDEMILIDRYGFKRNWWRKPVSAFGEMFAALGQVREQEYDLAIDLQGLAKTVVFLYGARARRKFAKGEWWGIPGYRNRDGHAIAEMDGLLQQAGIAVPDTSMELVPGEQSEKSVDQLLTQINPGDKPLLVMSPYSRWKSKDWPIEGYVSLARDVSRNCLVIFTGASDRRQDIDHALEKDPGNPAINLAGRLSLLEFAELVGRSRMMVTGDSFPMHVAGAMHIPVVALFAPTDERRVGPLGPHDQVIRAPQCHRCDRAGCERNCLSRIKTGSVMEALQLMKIIN